MQFFVILMTGKNIVLNMGASDTIKSIKDKIYEIDGVPQDQQRLTFSGKQL